jgi:hypothetical protein
MEDLKPGFYKIIDEKLWCAPNAVYAPNYTLKKEEKDNFEYPVDGWHWFDSEAQAREHFQMPLEEPEE